MLAAMRGYAKSIMANEYRDVSNFDSMEAQRREEFMRVHVEGLQKNLRKFVWLGGTMLHTNLVFQSFPTLHSARIASQIHPVLLH